MTPGAMPELRAAAMAARASALPWLSAVAGRERHLRAVVAARSIVVGLEAHPDREHAPPCGAHRRQPRSARRGAPSPAPPRHAAQVDRGRAVRRMCLPRRHRRQRRQAAGVEAVSREPVGGQRRRGGSSSHGRRRHRPRSRRARCVRRGRCRCGGVGGVGTARGEDGALQDATHHRGVRLERGGHADLGVGHDEVDQVGGGLAGTHGDELPGIGLHRAGRGGGRPGQRLDHECVGAADHPGGALLVGTGVAEVDRVDVGADARRRVGRQVVHRPRGGHTDGVPERLHELGGAG